MRQAEHWPASAVIATSRLAGWGGAEVVACEMAEALIARGVRVKVFAYAARPEIRSYLEALTAEVFVGESDLDLEAVDLVYSQHQVASHLLFRQLKDRKLTDALPLFVYNHLSPYESMELPGPVIEAEIADLIWCNSAETRRAVAEFGPRFAEATVVPNPAPARFFASRPQGRGKLASVLAVSNHIPTEMAAALDLLEARGVRVTRIGAGHQERRVVPEDFLAHDAIVTIGKSVQYAFASHMAVYCYDRFAGPGWIATANFAEAEALNFSGRCTPQRRDAKEIAAELMDGYAKAADFAAGLGEAELARWRLDRIVDDLVTQARDLRADPGRGRRLSDLVGSEAFLRKVIAEGHVQENLRREMAQRLAVEDVVTRLVAKRRNSLGKRLKRFVQKWR